MTTKFIYQQDHVKQSLASGDKQSFEIYYQQYYLAIYHFAKKIINDPAEAEDITADTFIKLWRQAETNRGVENVKAFLHITAKNACLDYIKTNRLHEEKEAEIRYLAAQDSLLTLTEIKAEVLQIVYSEIEKLPKKCREIFKLSYIEGLKVPEVARHLNLSEQTVSNQKTRALKILRLALQDKHWMILLWLIKDHS